MNKLNRCLTIATIAIAAPAMAGEITGNGNYTPINDFTASSICAFSGRNDDGDGPNARVQGYGVIRATFGGPAPFHGLPGDNCRGNL